MRNTRSRSPYSLLLAMALPIILSLLACTKPIREARLPEPEILPLADRIEAEVGLCLPSKFRGRIWSVSDYPYQVVLGKPAAVGFERMTKQMFRDVLVRFEEDCAKNTTRPWLTAEIISANRETPNEASGELHYTAVRLKTSLRTPEGATVWSFETVAIAGLPRLTLFERALRELRLDHAARSFGEAIEIGLRSTRDDLLSSRDVRRYFEARADTSRGTRSG